MKNKIILGTAKLGDESYGFSSESAHLNSFSLLEHAQGLGIEMLDTSPRYRRAEMLIGEYNSATENKFLISTKVDNLRINDRSSHKSIFDSALTSMKLTKTNCLETLFLHQNQIEILKDSQIQEGLTRVKEEGLVKHIGVSIYSLEECEYALNSEVFDVIQLPLNVADSFIYSKIKNFNNKKLIARSLFLQGVLFNRLEITRYIKQHKQILAYLSLLDDILKKYKLQLDQVACSFVANLPEIDQIIVGTKSGLNLEKMVLATNQKIPEQMVDEISDLSSDFKEWANPRNW